MLLPAVLLLGALGQAPPPPRPGAEVALEARAIVIPGLPASITEARRNYGSARRELENSYREAERYLAACAADRAALGQPEAQITIPPAFAGEAKTLGQFLYDETYLALEEPVLDRWNTWQNTLLSQGMAQPREAQRMADTMRLLSSSKTEVAGRAYLNPGQAPFVVLWEDASGQASLTLPRRTALIEILALDRLGYSANTEFGQQATAYANDQAAKLAHTWAPLTSHLNRGASALLDLDRTAVPTRDPGMRALRLLARIHFMERFRSTLWFCQVVWAHMASERILTIRQM